jgi:hypothetical protein
VGSSISRTPPTDRAAGAKDLVFDVGSETFGVRRLMAG